MSLLEVLVVAVLLVLLMGLVFNFLIPGIRVATWGMLRVGMEQELVTALNRVTADLQLSVPNGVTISYNPAAVATNWYAVGATGQVADGAGNVNWEKQFNISYLDSASQEFRHRVWPCSPAGSSDPALPTDLNTMIRAKKIPAPLLPAICTDSSVCRVLARSVVEFRIEPSGCDLELRQPLKFTLVSQRSGNTGHPQPEKWSYSRSVFLAGSQ